MRLGDRLLVWFAPPLAVVIIRLLHLTLRCQVLGQERLTQQWEKGQNVILSFWHDQLLMMALGYPGKKSRILISASKDGELIARVMRFFGQDAVRGSSNRGGREAFKHLLKIASEPTDLVITPDGPKGPRHQIKDGVVQLARLTGRPVIPMSFVASRGHRFASWDRFLLPYPLARGVYSFGEPVFYVRGETTEVFRGRIEQAMKVNQRTAEEGLEAKGETAV
ncbi:lysophospholipid acyltransferase family protein [Geopsychrobacter electrodiphilus]|uniref:lysophospholipid acyltransferase family protein n=1 Tax=Geopsychrobacter electrodiphilus TaxID=225196 RepID=UPI0003670D54|nr:lysophospholipid acyltransferase family protein [Geopsychrobacter electrodiphilus]